MNKFQKYLEGLFDEPEKVPKTDVDIKADRMLMKVYKEFMTRTKEDLSYIQFLNWLSITAKNKVQQAQK